MSEAQAAQIAEFFRDLSSDDKHALLTNDDLARLAAQILSATEFRPSLLVVRHNHASRGAVLDYARVYLHSGRQLGRTGDAIAVLLLKSAIRDLHEEARNGMSGLRAGMLSATVGSLAGVLIGAFSLGLRPISLITAEFASVATCLTTLLIVGFSAIRYKKHVNRWRPRTHQLQDIAGNLERIAGDISSGVYDSRTVAIRLTDISGVVECIPFELLEIVQSRKARHFRPNIDQPLVIGPLVAPYSDQTGPTPPPARARLEIRDRDRWLSR